MPEELLGEVRATNWWLHDTWPDSSVDAFVAPEAPTVRSEAAAHQPVIVAPETSLDSVARELVAQQSAMMVVVDEERRPLGVLTAAHVLRAARKLSALELTRATALDAATSGGALIPATATLATAARMLITDDRHFGVVVDEEGRLLGLLTATAIVRALLQGQRSPLMVGVRLSPE